MKMTEKNDQCISSDWRQKNVFGLANCFEFEGGGIKLTNTVRSSSLIRGILSLPNLVTFGDKTRKIVFSFFEKLFF